MTVTPQIAAAADGTVVIVAPDGTVRYLGESIWIEFQSGFSAIAIACYSADYIAAVGADGYIYTWSGSAWAQHDNLKQFKKVEYDLYNHILFGIGTDDLLYNWGGNSWVLTKCLSKDCLDLTLYHNDLNARVIDLSDGLVYAYTSPGWQPVTGSPVCTAITMDVVSGHTYVHAISGGEIKSYTADGWGSIPHPDLTMIDIDSYANGSFWAIGYDEYGEYYAVRCNTDPEVYFFPKIP
ncbi:MAG: hypothetical protein WC390_12295, partial [Sulfurimonas sp.]